MLEVSPPEAIAALECVAMLGGPAKVVAARRL
jgi:hypothetical protein